MSTLQHNDFVEAICNLNRVTVHQASPIREIRPSVVPGTPEKGKPVECIRMRDPYFQFELI